MQFLGLKPDRFRRNQTHADQRTPLPLLLRFAALDLLHVRTDDFDRKVVRQNDRAGQEQLGAALRHVLYHKRNLEPILENEGARRIDLESDVFAMLFHGTRSTRNSFRPL